MKIEVSVSEDFINRFGFAVCAFDSLCELEPDLLERIASLRDEFLACCLIAYCSFDDTCVCDVFSESFPRLLSSCSTLPNPVRIFHHSIDV